MIHLLRKTRILVICATNMFVGTVFSQTVEGSGYTIHYGVQNVKLLTNTHQEGGYFLFDAERNLGVGYRFKRDFYSVIKKNHADINMSNVDKSRFQTFWLMGLAHDYFKLKHNWVGLNNTKDMRATGIVLKTTGVPRWLYHNAESNRAKNEGYMVLKYSTNLHLSPRAGALFHEYVHGVVDKSRDFNSRISNEVTSVSEGIADCLAVAMQLYWDISNKPWKSIITHDVPLRDFKNPKSAGGPDTYKGINWGISPHHDSTVFSHWYYILSEGKSGINDNGFSYNVKGIGNDDATKIIFELATKVFGSSCDYKTTRNAVVRTAKRLFGENSNQVKQVILAWEAVGLPGSKQKSFNTNDTSNQIRLFPNPVKNQLQIVLPETDNDNNYSYSIYDVSGIELLKGTIENINGNPNLNVSRFPKGVYFISLSSNHSNYSQKFIKN